MLNMRIEIFGVVQSDECLSQLEAAALYASELTDDLSPDRIRAFLLELGSSEKPLVMDIEEVDGDMSELRACLRSHKLGYRCSYAADDADQYDTMAVYGPTLGEEVIVDLTETVPERPIQEIIDEFTNATPQQMVEINRRDLIQLLRTTDAGIIFDIAMSERYGVVRAKAL